MIKDKVIILTRSDLIIDNKDIAFEDVSLIHFPYIYREEIKLNAVVLFIEDDLRTRIIKNRYGKKYC